MKRISFPLALGITVILLLSLTSCADLWRTTMLPNPSLPTAATPTTQATTTQPHEVTAVTVATTKPLATTPALLTEALAEQGFSLVDLQARRCRQLITVTASGTSATIRFYECVDDVWSEVEERACSGFIGRNGLTDNKREGDGCSPSGLYRIGEAFHIPNPPPDTRLAVFRVTQDSYWVDDPASEFYNQYVVGTAHKDWNSAEHMIEYPAYNYGFVVNYNIECVKNNGSAIFFHIGDHPTNGCVATAQSNVLAYLSMLDSDQNPHILFTR